jgi:hypothetical protein
MSSKLFLITPVLLLGLLLLSSCTEEMPVDAVYTNDMDWTPSIVLSHNDYQRVAFTIERPPRKELLRNILWYRIQVRSGTSTSYQNVDSIPGGNIIPPYPYWSYYSYRSYPYTYTSRAMFSSGTTSSLRVEVQYRLGITHSTSDLTFTSPPERGMILKRIPLPKKISTSDWGNQHIAFYRGRLLVLRDDELWSVDTASGQSTILLQNFRPRQQNPAFSYNAVSVAGDSLVAWFWNAPDYVVVNLDLKTLKTDSIVIPPFSGRYLNQMKTDGSQLYGLWLNYNGDSSWFCLHDRHTGVVLKSSAGSPNLTSYPYDYCWASGSWWFSLRRDFDNRMIRFDPQTLATLEDRPNPVFSTHELAWDGANFWEIDEEAGTIVKFVFY